MSSLRDKIGQMLLFGWSGDTEAARTSVGNEALWLINEMRAGSVILMGDNIDNSSQLLELTSGLQAAARQCGLEKLLIATDQEGGRVCRLKYPPFRKTREAWEIGHSGPVQAAFDEGAAIGSELLAHGINWALAPVLDVNNNPHNPVIGTRSFSDDAKTAAQFGVASVRGFQDSAKVLACGKHFPGHGDTAVDSHLDLPVVGRNLDELGEVELLPFSEAIKAGIGSIMTAHILLTEIDPLYPATMSKLILTGLLRDEMAFDGVIVTDCLTMHAISKRWSSAEAAVLAVKAGADVLLCVGNQETQRSIRDGLVDAVKAGEISESRIDDSVARVVAAKSRFIN